MGNVKIKRYKKVLVANRGEIAIRVYRALNELGIQTVGIFSKEDKYALFRTKTDEAYMLNPEKGPLDAYLDIKNIIKIAKAKGVDAIHPGYGFLSENPEFVEACKDAGIDFIGPDVDVMYKMGDKISSKKMAIECGVPIIPGVDYAIRNLDEVMEVAANVGYPVMLKASNGGGGRGMRIVNSAEEMPTVFEEARNEAKKAFGDDKIFVEKYLRDPKHIEVQVLGDKYGNVVHLFDRDCSVQRRHQKVVEFAPAFTVSEPVRQKILTDAVRLSKHVGYKNAGTLEFLVDADENYYFIQITDCIVNTGNDGNTTFDRHFFRRDLIAHFVHNIYIGADKVDTFFFTSFYEFGVFGQETITGMDGIYAFCFSNFDNIFNIQISIQRTFFRIQHIRFVGFCTEQCIFIFFRENTYCLNTQFIQGTINTDSNFATVCNENFFVSFDFHVWHWDYLLF